VGSTNLSLCIGVLTSAVPRPLLVSLSSLQSGDVPSLNISFAPSVAVHGNGTLTLAVSSTSPLAGVEVFAGATPGSNGVVVVGLANCTGATAAIDAANDTLTITLPSGCVLPAHEAVTVEVPSAFLAPNPAAGTKVALSLTTSADPQPSVAAEYTIGVRPLPLPRCMLCSPPPLPLRCQRIAPASRAGR
jgi:hypothetical protein